MIEGGGAGDGFEHLGGDGAGAVDEHRGLGRIEDGGFDADGGGAAVEDGVDAVVEVFEDVSGGGGAGASEAVGAGGGDGDAGWLDERGAMGWAGMRTPTRGRPAVTVSGMLAVRGRRRVSGPGQKAAMRASALRAGRSATWSSMARSLTWTMSGSQWRRSLAAKMRATASGSRALAPRP